MDIPSITVGIARRVHGARKRQGLTAERLASLLRDQGVPWDRSIVANLETGRRQNVTVVELLTLARVLNVAPVHLLVEPSGEGGFQVTPTESQPMGLARAWIRGEQPLPGTDERVFRTEVPLEELGRTARSGGAA